MSLPAARRMRLTPMRVYVFAVVTPRAVIPRAAATDDCARIPPARYLTSSSPGTRSGLPALAAEATRDSAAAARMTPIRLNRDMSQAGAWGFPILDQYKWAGPLVRGPAHRVA